jgi:diguanylate cyclase (GGDEF)-like protein
MTNVLARFANGKNETDAASSKSAEMAAQLLALGEIVDGLDYGIVVLDQERHVQFVNRAFRRFWRVPDAVADRRQSFVKLMYHGRGATAYAVSQERLGDYVARQLDLIRTGDERPLNIRLRLGEVLQFRCKALPNGGRILTYSNVSELARQADALEQLASTDAMTGLNNRRHFLVLAESEWARFQRYGRPLALLMIDIDLFKSINDSHGHAVGDLVIKSVANVLQTQKRSSDIAGRLGGEEFALILPEATADSAVAAGERLRRLVADEVITVGDRRIAVTISVGASICGMGGIEELLTQADLALYAAKRSGRNRVCRFAPDTQPGVQADGQAEHQAGLASAR